MIRIGTRKSKLALWQAKTVEVSLHDLGLSPTLFPMSSQGDLIQDKPLHLIGGSGLFTKVLDQALLENSIDIAVHSLKDYPTEIPEGLTLAAVLPRADAQDVLAYKGEATFFDNISAKGSIATGSPRRKAQWLHKYPHFSVVGLRGNVPTRLQKLADSENDGAIFAKAGLDRLEMLPKKHILLDWMVPAPAQGIVAIVCRTDDETLIDSLQALNHGDSFLAASIERDFLNQVEGGCSAPIGAHVEFRDTDLFFRGRINSLDGKEEITIEESFSRLEAQGRGRHLADLAIAQGADKIIENIKEMESSGV